MREYLKVCTCAQGVVQGLRGCTHQPLCFACSAWRWQEVGLSSSQGLNMPGIQAKHCPSVHMALICHDPSYSVSLDCGWSISSGWSQSYTGKIHKSGALTTIIRPTSYSLHTCSIRHSTLICSLKCSLNLTQGASSIPPTRGACNSVSHRHMYSYNWTSKSQSGHQGHSSQGSLTVKTDSLTEGGCVKMQRFPNKASLAMAVHKELGGSHTKKKMSRLKRIILRERADKAASQASTAAELASEGLIKSKSALESLQRQLKVGALVCVRTTPCAAECCWVQIAVFVVHRSAFVSMVRYGLCVLGCTAQYLLQRLGPGYRLCSIQLDIVFVNAGFIVISLQPQPYVSTPVLHISPKLASAITIFMIVCSRLHATCSWNTTVQQSCNAGHCIQAWPVSMAWLGVHHWM